MNRDIIARKRKYEDMELSFDDRLDLMLERKWGWKAWTFVIGCALLLLAGAQVFLGLN